MIKGLYFYKLVSPYQEDVTKDCKLTINEIDSNFLNLKNADIIDAQVDEETKEIILTKNDGEKFVLNLSEITKNADLDVKYNSIDGVIEITYDGETYAIKDLITKDNLSKEILTKVYSNCTLEGIGTSTSPLGIASVQKTGSYKSAIKVLNTIMNERLPNQGVAKGDRYVTVEEVSDFGLLYNFESVKRINDLLRKTGWRVATKNDWDSMLNAIEPCEYRDHASTLNNRVLGHVAGSLLKATHDWRVAGLDSFEKPDHCHPHDHDHGHKPKCHADDFDPESVEETVEKFAHHPEKKKFAVNGKDAYGMGILPGGYAYYSRPMQYNQFGFQGAYWTSDTLYDTGVYTKVFESNESGVLQVSERPSAFLSVRLVKDYDGTNDKGVENILGDDYKTVLMPSLNNPNGYAVWTAQNFRLREAHLESAIPNAGLGVKRNVVYFINEWNGFGWDKLQMEEGDSITILISKNPNETYKVIEGKLVNVTSYIADNIRHEIKDDLDGIRTRIHDVEHAINDNRSDIEKIGKKLAEIDVVNSVQDDRLQRAEDSIESIKWHHKKDVKDILDKIDDLSKSNQETFDELEKKVDEKFEELDKKDEELEQAITDEKERAEEVEKALDEKINSETERAEEAEKALDEKIESETERAEAKEQELDEKIDSEIKRAEEAEKKLQENINAEQERAEAKEQELQDAIDELDLKADDLQDQITAEVERATKAEEELDERVVALEERALTNESNYDDKEGKLTLVAENPENNIEILFSFDFGTL